MNAQAGEDIRVLRDDEHNVPTLMESDYWVVNDRLVVPMMYDGRGQFIGAGILPPDRTAKFLEERDVAWSAAEPFPQWWGRHPELHRGSRMAA